MEIYSQESGQRLYHGEFNEDREREGWGIQYDEKSGAILLEGIWKRNKLVEIVRKIEGSIMTEFKRNGNNIIASNRIPVYVGEYIYDESKESFIRNGRGYYIDEETRIAYREVEWRDGVEVGGRDLYDGWYTCSAKPKPKPKYVWKPQPVAKPVASPITTPIELSSDELDFEVDSPPEPSLSNEDEAGHEKLKKMCLNMTDLVVSSSCHNKMYVLDFSTFDWLKSIEIGSGCFESVGIFKIDGLHRLKTIKIGSNSFTQKKNSYGNDQPKSFHILNCKSLESIQIGERSFEDFEGGFEMKKCPKLQYIHIGTIGFDSRNFSN